MGAVEVPKSTCLIIGSTAKCPSLDRQLNAEQSMSFFKSDVAVLSRQSGLLSHQDGQGGRDSVVSSCASAIFCGTVALSSASTVIPMMENFEEAVSNMTSLNILPIGVREATPRVPGLYTLSTGARVIELDQVQVMMSNIKPCIVQLYLRSLLV
jgi:hypothetical protein